MYVWLDGCMVVWLDLLMVDGYMNMNTRWNMHTILSINRSMNKTFSMNASFVKLLPLRQPQMRVRTYAETNPSTWGATQLRSVLARVCSVSRQNLNTTSVP
jgi:hypothetical protein